MSETLLEFALSHYRQKDIADCCLRLQDNANADINMLLAGAWLASRGDYWSAEQVRELIALCADWRAHCVLPLRTVRRYLQSHPLYEQAKKLEIDAEIQQLAILADALTPLMTTSKALADALSENLTTYIEAISTPISAAVNADLRLLIERLT